jgi:hypothetical protein
MKPTNDNRTWACLSDLAGDGDNQSVEPRTVSDEWFRTVQEMIPVRQETGYALETGKKYW